DIKALKKTVFDSLAAKMDQGLARHENATFLHTEPHHDDIMLGYLPALVRDLQDESTRHFFSTLTSGFTAVTNGCFAERVHTALSVVEAGAGEDALDPDGEIRCFLYGLAAKNKTVTAEAEGRRFIRCVKEAFGVSGLLEVKAKLEWLIEYLRSCYPGKKDIKEVQILKGMMREWEIELLWGAFGIKTENISHLRLGFYQGDLFTEEPTQNRDVPPIIDLMEKVNPDILTVAFDPEASGPDTHYKVLQAVASALRRQRIDGGKPPDRIWGYRNVWYRFHPAEADLFVPVSVPELAIMHRLFMNIFITQRNASFPSFEHNGPFSGLAQRIQVEQFDLVRTCLGDDWFRNHESPRVRSARAMVFLKEMTVEAFLGHARDIRKQAENF
ncbi:MAG: glucosamine-6-phosphate deaminase, partial [Planctomycetes bacterium]|nr:glucosamine-6-phosphate deaminase [Planctomycetota bacterium]